MYPTCTLKWMRIQHTPKQECSGHIADLDTTEACGLCLQIKYRLCYLFTIKLKYLSAILYWNTFGPQL